MAAFFFRYAKVTNYEAPQTPQFKDVDRNNPFYREISWFKDQHITTGWGDGTFRPNEPIQRAAMAAFIHRFAVK
jgi:serine protease, subtilase family